MKLQRGFTLIEVLIYASTLAITAGLLTAVLSNTLRIRNREANSTELAQQLNFVLGTVQSLVNESALIDSVYETGSPGTVCSNFCTLKLRMTASSTDPTFVHATADGVGVYLTQGQASPNTSNPLTGTGVTVDHFELTKFEFEGGHASVRVDMALTIDSTNPQFAVTRSIQSAIGRVTAAVFDDHLLPNADNSFDVGQVTGSKRWKDGAFSGNVTIGGNVGIGTTGPVSKLDLGTNYSDPGTYPNKITLWNGGANNYFGFGISSGDLDYFSQGNHRFYTGYNGSAGSEKMVLTTAGNVGIGTTAPLTKLAVVGDIGQGIYNIGTTRFVGLHGTGGSFADGQGGASIYFTSFADGGGYSNAIGLKTHHYGVSDITRMFIDKDGNVGIGTTSPGAKLDINNGSAAVTYPLQLSNSITGILIAKTGINFTAHGRTFASIVGGQQADNTFAYGDLGFYTEINDGMPASPQMYIQGSTGNVGIGTTNPGYKLDVNGSARFAGVEIFQKGGNNGTVSGDTFCAGAQWGTTGSCIGQKRDSDGAYFPCSSVVGSQLMDICVRIP